MKLCGISPSRTMGVYFTRNNDLTLYFKSDAQEKYTGFDMVITRFRYGIFTFFFLFFLSYPMFAVPILLICPDTPRITVYDYKSFVWDIF